MPDKLHKTKGIVLRTVKYGETSVIVTIFTELFGLQSYLVNGVRVSTKKGSGKASLFQPAALLDLVAYHNELKNLNRLREFRWSFLYRNVLTDVRKNAVALFMIELLTRCLKQPEPNADLFYFIEDCFIHLDESDESVTANFPLFFALHLTGFFGIPPAPSRPGLLREAVFDLQEGVFSEQRPAHPHVIEGHAAQVTAELLQVRRPEELKQIRLNQELRRELLAAYQDYYSLHIQDFGVLKTLPVLREILN
ncbi:MAG TPA: DNA repair protein RecO [Chitinophagaceae bacterium]|nr:DNA repair protein RecO [Chitinophagaceae bacterium]